MPLMVSGKVVPLLERGEGARPEVHLKASWSWDPDSRWTDEMFKHVVLWNVRGILREKKPHLDILDVSCHTNSEFTPRGALKKTIANTMQRTVMPTGASQRC